MFSTSPFRVQHFFSPPNVYRWMYQLAASATSVVYPVAWSRPTLALFGVRDDWVIFIYNITTSQDFDAGCFWMTGGMRLTLHMTSHTQNWPPLPPASLTTAWETESAQEKSHCQTCGRCGTLTSFKGLRDLFRNWTSWGSTSYLRRLEFKAEFGSPAFVTEGFVVLFSASGQMWGDILKLGHE